MGFNRKERLKMAKKIGEGSRATKKNASWHMLKLKKRAEYESKLIEYSKQYKREKGIYHESDEEQKNEGMDVEVKEEQSKEVVNKVKDFVPKAVSDPKSSDQCMFMPL